MEKDRRFIETIGKNIDYTFGIWKRLRDNEAMELLNSNIKFALDIGADITVRVKSRAFRKENIVTYFPDGMKDLGKMDEDGSMTFEISAPKESISLEKQASLYVVEGAVPYVVVYSGACSLAARFSPSDIESIHIH